LAVTEQIFSGLSSFIDGHDVAFGDNVITFAGPTAGARPTTMLEAGKIGVRAAVSSASKAAERQRRTATSERIVMLQNAAAVLEAHRDSIAKIICADIGKPIRVATIEVERGVAFFRGCAAAVANMGGDSPPLDAVGAGNGLLGITRRVPYGVIAAVTPFNAPINLLVQKLAPAIAAGNAVVVKPAPQGLGTALALAHLLFSEAGWPAGLFNVVSGDRETAAALVEDPGVQAVSFTGSTAGGNALARFAGAKKFVAELGSNAANVVFADADLASAATKIAAAGFEASGQQCISAQRVIVEHSASKEFSEFLLKAACALKVGDPWDIATDIGPLANPASADRVMAMCEDARDSGAEILLEPRRSGCTVTPAILSKVSRSARLWREEVFGPVIVLSHFQTDDEALALANDSEFGLQGAVFTNDLSRTLRFARDFDVGSLWINEASRFRLDNYPFGGVKASGMGREGVRYAIEELSQLKFVGIRA
jgi:acyl-CoA reductase-like NAD-dependent aldehyde dehydrogenase